MRLDYYEDELLESFNQIIEERLGDLVKRISWVIKIKLGGDP